MQTHSEVTRISVYFVGIKKRARKPDTHVERLNEIYDNKHNTLTPDDFNAYERKAWDLIDSLGYKQVKQGSVNVQHGTYDGTFLSINLAPKQRQLITR